MKNKILLFIAVLILIVQSTVYAITDKGTTSKEAAKITDTVDNSNMIVNVIRQKGDKRSRIYSGPLGLYNRGEWSKLDFSDYKYIMIFNWESTDDDVICIVPAKFSEIIGEDLAINSDVDKTIVQKSMVMTTIASDINADVSVLYNNALSEYMLEPGKRLTAEINLKNNGLSVCDVNAMIALYDDSSKLVAVNSESTDIESNEDAVLSPQITIPTGNVSFAKLMLWKGSSMQPYTNPVVLTISGTDFFGDDYNLATDLGSRNTAIGMINTEDDVDIFEFKSGKAGLYAFECYGEADTYAVLCEKDSPDDIIKTSVGPKNDFKFRLAATLEEEKSYYLKICGTTTGKYKLIINYEIGTICCNLSPVSKTGDEDFDSLIMPTCTVYSYQSGDFVGKLKITSYTEIGKDSSDFWFNGLFGGEYLVKIERPGFLTRYSKIELDDNEVNMGNVILFGGDINGDDVIDSEDMELFESAMGSFYGFKVYNIKADFNGDGTIDDADKSVITANMGKTPNSYNTNVNFIGINDILINDLDITVTGKTKPETELFFSVYSNDLLVYDEIVSSGSDGSFNIPFSIDDKGTYTFYVRAENGAFDVEKTITCN